MPPVSVLVESEASQRCVASGSPHGGQERPGAAESRRRHLRVFYRMAASELHPGRFDGSPPGAFTVYRRTPQALLTSAVHVWTDLHAALLTGIGVMWQQTD